MVEFFVQNQQALSVVIPRLRDLKIGAFKKKIEPLAAEECKELADLVRVLRPVADATQPLSGSKYVTISFGYMLVRAVLTKTTAVQLGLPAESPVADLAARLVAEINRRFQAASPTEIIAHSLDPRFKKTAQAVEVASVLGQAWEMERAAMEAENAAEEKKAEAVQEQKVEEGGKEEKADDAGAGSGAADVRNSSIESLRELFGLGKPEPPKLEPELTRYLDREGVLDLALDPLAWWASKASQYPVMTRMVKRYLCIQASSVACERVWSAAGNVMTARRAGLKSTCLEALLIIHENHRTLSAATKA